MSSNAASAFFLGVAKPPLDSLSAGDVIGVVVMGNVPVCTGDPAASFFRSCGWNPGDVSGFVMRCGVLGTDCCWAGVAVPMDLERVLTTFSPSFVLVVSEFIISLSFLCVSVCLSGYDKKGRVYVEGCFVVFFCVCVDS